MMTATGHYRFSDEQVEILRSLGVVPRNEPPAAFRTWRFTSEQYDEMVAAGVFDDGPGCELLDGEVVEKMGMDDRHWELEEYLNRWAVLSIPETMGKPFSQSPFRMGRSQPEPDIGVVRGPRRRAGKPGVHEMALAIEVADSSLRRDLGWKARLYAEAGLPELWIVDVPNALVVVHRSPQGGRYATIREFGAGERISPAEYLEAVLDIADLFAWSAEEAAPQG
jgi:Uma2 family endonuclease